MTVRRSFAVAVVSLLCACGGSVTSGAACDDVAGNCVARTTLGKGVPPQPGLSGVVTASGGTVSRLYFAVVGDTRPAVVDDTRGYPIAIIDKIYDEIQALDPRPQFVIATGDYLSADPYSPQADVQLGLYRQAMSRFDGPVFASMGNHECATLTDVNCASWDTTVFQAFRRRLVAPLGYTKPYYTVNFALDGGKTAKLVNLACSAWDRTQRDWFAEEMAKPTTTTIVVRHHPSGGPCSADAEAVMATQPWDLLVAGHVHDFSHDGKRLVVGVSGAPLTGTQPFGFATVEQLVDGTFRVNQYDEATGLVLSTFAVP